jgi:soluble lytic murein transglycosylase-like protein
MKNIYWLLIIYIGIAFAQICRADQASEETTIRQVAKQEGFDADLAVAVAKVESKLNPNVVGTQGEISVYQLKPNYHPVVNGLDTLTNARVAIRYMKQIKQRFEPKYGDAWIIFYNLGPNYKKQIKYPRLFPYYVKVHSTQERIIAWNAQ